MTNFELRLIRTSLREADISPNIYLTILETQNLNLMKNSKLNKI